jgi:nucleoside-diphosphate-sugar epimerase
MRYSGTERIFNIGSGSGTTVNSLASALIGMMKKCNTVTHLAPHPGEPSNSVAEIRLARSELGFNPQWSLDDKLPELIEWYAKKSISV